MELYKKCERLGLKFSYFGRTKTYCKFVQQFSFKYVPISKQLDSTLKSLKLTSEVLGRVRRKKVVMNKSEMHMKSLNQIGKITYSILVST